MNLKKTPPGTPPKKGEIGEIKVIRGLWGAKECALEEWNFFYRGISITKKQALECARHLTKDGIEQEHLWAIRKAVLE